MSAMNTVKIIGGGLAGCEAAYQLLKRGFFVELYEMRPEKFTPAHKTDKLAELVCSNSLKSLDLDTASGMLKAEMRLLDSLVLRAAEHTRVPAGSALAVDRDLFSDYIDNELAKFEKLRRITAEVTDIGEGIVIIATGPLTSDGLIDAMKRDFGAQNLSFFDAAAPIVDADSVDMQCAYFAARYGKGEADYLNLPMNEVEYKCFQRELCNAQTISLKDFEINVFEGCMPIEVMAKRGEDTMRFGPLRPVGLNYTDADGNYVKPYAVVQLRKENTSGEAYNLVGFQTNLTFGEQRRVFGLIPALKNAEYLRYGVMHKNTFINSPELLDACFRVKNKPNVFVAGQLSGVEGYMESAVSGLLCGIHAAKVLSGGTPIPPPITTICGALSAYVATPNADFQPMNANFGILPPLLNKPKDKKLRKTAYSERGVADAEDYVKTLDGNS